ncbi:hypothetical protein conserved [Leishmania donovani]|uniref:Uncharacterized protein n=3 Tax=Leishmania donovani species complex TaxID=38574 RepID=A4I121_LEIIN|nr:conserved hypothetical protein [Leishmania infantum JPCM5]TPP45014.1 hypothetical protein CGC20_12460 [Leishmania donovani]CAC9492601.1 hypothetical_protein_-_conserved [Leishmania infantum]CAJ1989295.1 hypothetical protein conserved [Leishmania donovani]CAM68446.1 conserved hypothetical protein [Leishmania infantum JPCM5]SUZ42300.1 hypothetical_protein_-_conserved [Leishmania infantum]|eukprot:XP_001466012.1 conserved hypothetical protein [Leishmania infantum JPCM5]
MKSVQAERDELLLYALRHPPPNVSLKLPDGCASLEHVDLTSCPSPTTLYAEAERAAQHAKGKKVPKFELDLTKCFTVIGSSSGGVQRAKNAAPTSRSKHSRSPPELPAKKEAKPDLPNANRGSYSTIDGSSSSPHVAAKNDSSHSPDKRGDSGSPKLAASEQSPPRPVQPPPGASNSAAQEGNKGLLGFLIGALKGLGSVEGAAAVPDSGRRLSGSSASTTNDSRASAASKRQGTRPASATGSSTGKILSSVWNPLSSSIQGVRQTSPVTSLPGAAKEELNVSDVARLMEQMQIPLCGTTPGTISSNIATQFGTVFDAAAQQRKMNEEATAAAFSFPRPPHIQLCEVLDSAPLAPFLDILPIFAYESLLLATGVLLTQKRDMYAQELGNVYRRVFNITEEQHTRSLANVTPPALRRALDDGDAVAKEERRRYLSELRPNASTLRLLCENSNDDDFVSRAEQLQSVIERYPDLPGDTQVPFAIRAMVFAACLIPLYHRDLSTLSPIYSAKDVESCLAALREYLSILPQTEHFCHLHAQLLASDKGGSVEAQAVFLKDLARSISHYGISGIANAQLTPAVKYAYYVMQETFCLAAVPMPWLDSSFSDDMQRSATAAFIEACLALPPCMLSAMVLVDDMPVLPPTSSSEDILLALMEVFVNSGVFRSYAELVDDNTNVQHLSAATLFQMAGNSLDTKQKAYCQMLTRSFPLAPMLIVPGRLRIGAYILLTRHWGGLYPGATQNVPKDHKASLDAFLDYLLDGCDGERRTSESKTLCVLLKRATQRYLAPLDTLAQYDEAAHVKFAKQLMEEISLPWADTVECASAPLGDVMRYVQAVFGAPRPPPLGGDPAAQQYARMCSWLDIVTALIEKCLEGFPTVAAAAPSDKMPALAAESECVGIACAKLCRYPALLPRGVHRLQTLVRVREGFEECLMRSRQQYDLVRRVTGAPPVPTDEITEKIWRNLYSAVLKLCNSLSIYILTQYSVKDLMSKFMQLDANQYKLMKCSAAKLEDLPMPRLYPDVTMQRILDEVRCVLDRVRETINFEPAVRQLRYRLGHYFTACLFAVYVDGAEVFLSPADAPLILADLDIVRAFFFEPSADKQRTPPTGRDHCNTFQGAAQALRVSSAELLEKLYSVVQYVMSKPSSELVTGGAGVPPLHTLPECSDNSPWCQYVVRRVLEHRKDFKSSMWESYKARVRAK